MKAALYSPATIGASQVKVPVIGSISNLAGLPPFSLNVDIEGSFNGI